MFGFKKPKERYFVNLDDSSLFKKEFYIMMFSVAYEEKTPLEFSSIMLDETIFFELSSMYIPVPQFEILFIWIILLSDAKRYIPIRPEVIVFFSKVQWKDFST